MGDIEIRESTEGVAEFLYDLHQATFREYVEKTWGWDEAFQRSCFDAHFDPTQRKAHLPRGNAHRMAR